MQISNHGIGWYFFSLSRHWHPGIQAQASSSAATDTSQLHFSQLANSLDQTDSRLTPNRFSVNPSKTKHIIIGTQQRRTKITCTFILIKLMQTNRLRTQSWRYLEKWLFLIVFVWVVIFYDANLKYIVSFTSLKLE